MLKQQVTIIMGILVFFIMLPSILAVSPDEYLNEFNNAGETCTAPLHMKFYESKQYSDIYFYSCCQGSNCIYLPFDVTKKDYYDNTQMIEYFRSMMAIQSVENGEITSSAYSYERGFDICKFLGGDVLTQESVNLASEGAYSAAPKILEAKNARNVKLAIDTARFTGLITKTNVISLGGSIACFGATRSENKALEATLSCSNYYVLLNNKLSYNGLTTGFYVCNRDALTAIGKSKEKLSVKAHMAIDWLLNILNPSKSISGIFKNLSAGLSQNNDKLISINYGNNYQANQAIARYQQKLTETNNQISNAENKYHKIKDLIPSKLRVSISNLFIEPKMDYSKAREQIDIAYTNIFIAKMLRDSHKYNSAMIQVKTAYEPLILAQEFIDKENCKEYHIKWLAVVILIIIILGVWFLLSKYDNDTFLLHIIFIILFVGSIAFIIMLSGDIHPSNTCVEPKQIIRNELIIQEPYILEENVTVSVPNITTFFVNEKNQTIKNIMIANPRSINVSEGACNARLDLFNPNQENITFNAYYNITLVANGNRTINASVYNQTIESRNTLRIRDKVLSNGATYCIVDPYGVTIEILPNEQMHKVNITSYYNITELRNVTYYINRTEINYI